MSFRRSPAAFTMFEMLIVFSLIGILIAMLLPAVQQVRESARRLSCQNNLLQITTAIKHYEASHEHFPPGVINDRGPVTNDELGLDISFLLILMPYLEQQSVFDNFDFVEGAYAEVNTAIRELNFNFYQCSSDSTPRTFSNYAGCHHHQEAPIDKDNWGLLFLNSAIQHREIQDGRAHTILVGEKGVGANELGWVSGTCSTLRNTGSLNPWSSKTWATGGSTNTAGLTGVAEELIVGGFSSRHPSGCNFGFADGSLRLLTYDIDATVLEHLGHRGDGAMMGRWD